MKSVAAPIGRLILAKVHPHVAIIAVSATLDTGPVHLSPTASTTALIRAEHEEPAVAVDHMTIVMYSMKSGIPMSSTTRGNTSGATGSTSKRYGATATQMHLLHLRPCQRAAEAVKLTLGTQRLTDLRTAWRPRTGYIILMTSTIRARTALMTRRCRRRTIEGERDTGNQADQTLQRP